MVAFQHERLDLVLNVFRHHWGGRTAQREAETYWQKCSTPFGITG